MSITTVTSSGQQSITVSGAQNSKITNLIVAVPNSEVSHALTSSLKKLMVRSRTGADIKFTFVSGETATKYVTIPKGSTMEVGDISFTSESLYLQTTKADTVEIWELY